MDKRELLKKMNAIENAENDLISMVLFQSLKKSIEWSEDKLEKHLKIIQELVNQQAEDGGLWFKAETAPEDYLQQELRKLHGIIEELYFILPCDKN